jgi:hypothetical protein
MSLRKTLFCLLVAFGAAIVPAASQTRVYADVDIYVAPPPPRYEYVPPRVGYVWAPGYWYWNGHRHVWVRGHWYHARHGHHWIAHRWEGHEGRWVFHRGYWERDG